MGDILGKIDTSDHACPDKNYNVIQNIIIDEMDRNLPVKRVRFNKYKHKDSPWITQGIINSIRFRDNIYKKLKSTPSENPLYETLDQNLHVYNTMLRKNIRKAKLDYYNSLFTKFKDDIKKTWDTIKSVMKKTKNKENIPECLIIDGKEIKDNITIAEKFNDFFIDVGPKFAAQINSEGKKPFTSYLSKNIEHTFNFHAV